MEHGHCLSRRAARHDGTRLESIKKHTRPSINRGGGIPRSSMLTCSSAHPCTLNSSHPAGQTQYRSRRPSPAHQSATSRRTLGIGDAERPSHLTLSKHILPKRRGCQQNDIPAHFQTNRLGPSTSSRPRYRSSQQRCSNSAAAVSAHSGRGSRLGSGSGPGSPAIG